MPWTWSFHQNRSCSFEKEYPSIYILTYWLTDTAQCEYLTWTISGADKSVLLFGRIVQMVLQARKFYLGHFSRKKCEPLEIQHGGHFLRWPPIGSKNATFRCRNWELSKWSDLGINSYVLVHAETDSYIYTALDLTILPFSGSYRKTYVA